ncbi:hypothetical protein ACP70R_028346 [Stipagrostis hirtigluma subsp. patula]
MCLHAKDFSCEEEGIYQIDSKSLIRDERGFQVHVWCTPGSDNDATIVRNIDFLYRSVC